MVRDIVDAPRILPTIVKTDSVVKDWLIEHCSFKQQTVLLSALRGCDGIAKEDPTKTLTRHFRSVILKDAHSNAREGSFMKPIGINEAWCRFLEQPDRYPVHWLMHFMHAVEIVGYYHPHQITRAYWFDAYVCMCKMLHVNPETKQQLEERLADE